MSLQNTVSAGNLDKLSYFWQEQKNAIVFPALRLVGNQKSAGMDMNSRRTFLRQISGAALALGAGSSWSSWASAQAQSRGIQMPGEDGMMVRSSRFVDLETPVEYFNTWLTPVPHFFLRNHMHEPSELSADDWRLTLAEKSRSR